MSADVARRRALLVAALAALRVNADEPELALVHRWLDNWNGLGLIATGMARQDFDLQLTRHDGRGWGARFYVTGWGHSMTSATGGGSASTPWGAVQEAAWDALEKADHPPSGPTPAEDVIML